MKKCTRLAIVCVSFLIFLITTSGWAANLVTNGSFEFGNTDFVSNFQYIDDSWDGNWGSGLWDPSTYTIATDPNIYHPDAFSYFDHTTGDGEGHMLAVNGNTVGETADLVWSQEIDASRIDINKNYIFSAWGSSWARSDIPGKFAVFIGGVNISGIVEAGTADLGAWNYREFMWTPQTSDAHGVTIQIFNRSQSWNGNDFALDDISLRTVPIPQTVWLLGTALLFLNGLRRKTIR